MGNQTILAAALRWAQRGAAPVAVRYRDKAPIEDGWQNKRLTEAELPAIFGNGPMNLGIAWGAQSKDLVDIDLDWPEAIATAAVLLPETAVYGRAGSRRSHRLYRVMGAVTHKWKVPAALVPQRYRAMIVELRAAGSQSVVPPSIHETGEAYEWDDEKHRAHEIEHTALVRRLNLVAAGALLAHSWKDGARHELALPLSGALLSSGYSTQEVEQLMRAIAGAVGDPEIEDRIRTVRDTAKRLEAGAPATGVSTLVDLVGAPVVDQLKKWLNIGSAIPTGIAAASPNGTARPFVGQEEGAELILIKASEVEERPVCWLWPDRFAMGKLSMIAGKPGQSKSVLTCEIASIVTRGGVWPLDGTRCEMGEVLMLSAEDDPEDTIVPRLHAAGAVLEKVTIIRGKRLQDGTERLVTFADVEVLDRSLTRNPGRFKLLTADPVGAFTAGKDGHSDTEVRELLAPLARLAEKHRIAIVLVAHFNKAQGMQAIYRVIGSVGFSASVRALYMLVPDPDDSDRVLLLPEKSTNASTKMLGLSYRLVNTDLGNGINAPKIAWESAGEMRTADEVMCPPKPDREAPERDAAKNWLLEQLKGGKVMLVRDLKEEAALGVEASWPTIERAARQLKVVGRGEKKARTWQLPEENTATQQDEQTIKPSKTSPSHAESLMPSTEEAGLPSSPTRRDGDGLDGKPQADLHPCTACEKLNVANFCRHYQRTMPYPERPNCCVHFEARQPDVRWEEQS